MKLIFLFVLLFTGTAEVYAQSSNDAVNRLVQRVMKEREIPGLQIAVIRRGKIALQRSFGVASLEFPVPVTDSTLFSINSIAKVFTGVAVMQLVEAGKLDIAAPASRYLNNLPAAWQQVTVQQLLGHISGLPDITDPVTDELVSKKGEDSAWAVVCKMPLEFKPGKRFSYNTTNYLLAGRIIDKLSGQPFTAFMKERQFAVAGMKQTCFGNSFDVVPNKAPTYSLYRSNEQNERVRRDKPVQLYEEFPPFLWTDAGAFSTAGELAHWIIALQNGRLLQQKSSVQTMWTPLKLNNGTYGGFGGLLNGYALGWPVVIRSGHRAVAPIGGGRAMFFVYPDDDLSIIALSNLTGADLESLIEEIAKLYLGSE